jgi:cysteine desulfurase / selenocysteine lyase
MHSAWHLQWCGTGSVTYLNFAAHGLLPRVAIQAVHAAIQTKLAPHTVGDAAFFEPPEQARTAISKLIGARCEDIALTSGAGAGLATLAMALDWQLGDEVVVARGEFPVQHATWSPLEAREAIRLRVVESQGRFISADALIEALTPQTRIVSVSHVRFDDGSLLDVQRLGRTCNERGIRVILDVSQSCGVVPIDVHTLGADALVCAGYKYLLGPWGSGFLWVRNEFAEVLGPLPSSWLAQDVSTFSALDYVTPAPARSAKRWDTCEYSSPYNFNLAAMAASLDLVLRIGPENVLEHNRRLIARLYSHLPHPCVPSSPLENARRGGFGCFTASSPLQTAQLHQHLLREGIIVALREGHIRIAPHLINSEADIDKLIAVIGDWSRSPIRNNAVE